MARYTRHTDMNTPGRRRDTYRTSTPPIIDSYLYASPLCFSFIKHAWTMSNSSGKPWLDGPSTPQIPHLMRFEEKTSFTGILLGAMLYGTPAHTPPPPLSSPRVHLASPFRNCYCPLLPMHECSAQFNQPCRAGCQMAACGPHDSPFFMRDSVRWIPALRVIHFFHR